MPEPPLAAPQLTLLFVDDDPALAVLGSTWLTQRGYAVVVATDGPTALAYVRAAPQRFALLITDYVMPGLTGLALATACRQVQPDLPVLLCTGAYATQADLPASTDIAAFLPKPFGAAQLAQAVAQVLGARSPRRPAGPARTS